MQDKIKEQEARIKSLEGECGMGTGKIGHRDDPLVSTVAGEVSVVIDRKADHYIDPPLAEAIAMLQRDLAEAMQEIGDLGYRVFQLEKANWPKPKEPPRFQMGYQYGRTTTGGGGQ